MPRVALVAGARTPFVKAVTHFKDVDVVDLATHAIDGLLSKHDLDPGLVQELHFGLVVLNPRVPHLAREAVFRSALGADVRAVTYVDNCITGTTAMAALHDAIALGRVEAGIAGGVESMSNTPLLYAPEVQAALRDAQGERSVLGKLKHVSRLRMRHLLPQLPGVTEPSTGLTMGDHTEQMVKAWNIAREPQDELALRSHQRAWAATQDGRLKEEIHPLKGIDHDTIVRGDTSLEKLARLKPVFDREHGTLTAGNSSPLTDGAAAVLLMSEERAKAEGREILAFVKDFENAALDPADGLLMGPGLAVPRMLRRNGLTLADIDLVEMHEAFAGQVLCNLAAWEKGWKEPAIGTVDPERLNVCGGSIAIGHPFAATGARIANTLARELARRDARYGLISICAAGAQASAMLLERA